jgi:hypothetical protein
MVLVSVVTSSSSFYFFSLSPHASTSTPPHSRQRAYEHAPPPCIHLTPAPTPTCAMAIARPQGRFTSCAHHRFRRCRMSRSSSRPSLYSSSPTCCPPPTVAAASRSTLVDAGMGRIGQVPGLSPCGPSRRAWWRLPRLGYLGDEQSRCEILDNQGP